MNTLNVTVWKAALLGGLLVFALLFWLNDHVGYEAKSAILFHGSSSNQDEVLARTVAAFRETEMFTERTLGSTRLQEEIVAVVPTEEQVDALKSVQVQGGKKGGLVIVAASHADAQAAEVLSREGTETLLRMSRMYLGNEKEFTSTVIDAPVVTKSLIHPVLYLLQSLVTALILFGIITLLEPAFHFVVRQFQSIAKRVLGKKQEEEVVPEHLDERFVPQKLDPTFLYQNPQPKAEDIIQHELYGEPEQNPLQSVSVSLEDLPFTFESSEEKKEESPVESVIEPEPVAHASEATDKEPTVLEYKRRLNELLAQK